MKVKKQVCDTTYDEVEARRYGCLSCRRTFRMHPQGINQRQFSQRVGGMAVMLYLLGLSLGAVVLMLDYRTPALGADLTSVKCKGKWLSKPWTSGFLVTDDADPLKTAADQNGVYH